MDHCFLNFFFFYGDQLNADSYKK